MEPIRQCASWGCFCRDGVTPQQLVTEAAKIGYAALEMPPAEHYDLIREHGLLIGTIVGTYSTVFVATALVLAWHKPNRLHRDQNVKVAQADTETEQEPAAAR